MTFGRRAECMVAKWLRSRGIPEVVQTHKGPYDIIAARRRVEVKASVPRNNGCWQFNIQRSRPSRFDESEVDVYVFAGFVKRSDKNPVFLVIPAPIGKRVLNVHPSQLFRYRSAVYNAGIIWNVPPADKNHIEFWLSIFKSRSK